ncbi:MAG TPA: bifunctional DNA-formamidopyrimidine glycosylase/DNA-(apurinic or apyrimidinic site) lyase [Candidatus Paceibacterota bacterium]
MPELPEVENLRRGLEKNIVGQKILSVKVRKPKLVSGKGNTRVASLKKVRELERGLKNEIFLKIERRAKNLIFQFRSGKLLLGHLKMSGQFVYRTKTNKTQVSGGHPIEISETQLPNKHSHIIFELQKGTLYYNDTRMFGYLLYYPTLKSFEQENHFALLGLEPLDKNFTLEYFEKSLRDKKGRIKAILMDQSIVTGLGNIYADETLFESRIHPERPATSITLSEIKLLHKAILRIISRAIEVGGSSVATYRLIDLSQGNYAREHKVYGKEGTNCPRCHHPLKKILIQTRTTIFCPHCQK